MATKLKSPHLLNASTNPLKMLENLRPLLSAQSLKNIENELNRHVTGLFKLGEEHLRFAVGISKSAWRHRISRLYYAAYNVRRAVQLKSSGAFATDVSDHENIEFPGDFPDRDARANRVRNLRNDRNLADYSHEAGLADLLATPDDVEVFVRELQDVARKYLVAKGVAL